MRVVLGVAFIVLVAAVAAPQATYYPGQATPPTLEEVRKDMGIPSSGDVRGQKDIVGFASTPEQMARVWELSATPPPPARLGPEPAPGVVGVICPHDDYIYAGRVYHQVVPLVTAKRVVLVGTFHRYRRFAAHDVLVFDSYRAWRAPDGEIPVSPLREAVLARMPTGTIVQSAAMHDSEHSLEAVAYWLKHINPELEIVPIIVPVASFQRMQELATDLGSALSAEMQKHGWQLGRDVAVAISSDAVHYGPDFNYTPFGQGGVEAYVKACDQDRALLTGPLAGQLSDAKLAELSATFVNPDDPNEYRLTWCGRFAIPLGLLLLERTAVDLGLPPPVGHPLVYATSVGEPELPARDTGIGETAPANLYHFVGYPAEAYTVNVGAQP
jgi:AmmeMemoRadiSam system protein B